MKPFWTTLCALSLLLGSLSTIYATDLIETWHSALSYDATIAAARSALVAGEEKEAQGRASLLPQAIISANAIHSQKNITAPSASIKETDKGLNYGVKASQVLYNASAFAQYQQGKQARQRALIQFQLAQQKLILTVAQAYFDALLAQEYLQQIGSQKKAITQQMEQAKKSFELGITTITDYKEAQARFDEISANEIAAQNDLVVKQNALTQLAQVDPNKLARLDTDFIPTPPTPNDLSLWLQTAEEKSLEIQTAKLNMEIAKEEIEKYRLLKSPTLNLDAGYTKQFARPNGFTTDLTQDRNDTSISLVLNVPLSTGGYRNSKLKESTALKEEARYTLEFTLRQVQHKTKAAFLGVNSGLAQISALERALHSNQSLLDSTQLGFEVGVRTTEDILNAQEQYYTVKYKLIEAKINYLLNRLRLAGSAGTLQEQDLQQVNIWLATNPKPEVVHPAIKTLPKFQKSENEKAPSDKIKKGALKR